MTVLSGQTIRSMAILDPCAERTSDGGLTYGLGPAGYDLRLVLKDDAEMVILQPGDFMLVAGLERFTMANNIIGQVHDKSTLARKGLAVQNTIIEPGWTGFLTLELTNHSKESIKLVRSQAIAQVVFHFMDHPAESPYDGKYQDQEAGPQGPRT